MCNLLRYKDRKKEPYADLEFSEVRIDPPSRLKVAPSQPAPMMLRDGRGLRIDMLRFGFRLGRGGRQMMARGETVTEKPMFRQAFKERRGVLLVHGFYDSLDMGRFKQPWYMQLKTGGLMAMAAIWNESADGGDFCILSAPANRVVARVIDRMPVILREDQWPAWMDKATTPDALQALLTPYEAAEMETWPVTRQVNQPGYEGPDCATPVVPEQPELDLF